MWGRDLVRFPELGLPEFEVPERSLLYRIPVMGARTAQAEGLLSYIVRLAAAHSVNPRRLVRKVYASSNPEFAKLYSAGFFIRHAGTINGLGKYAELFLGETEKLIGASFLRPMTLLSLKHLLPHNGSGLLVRRPKWCPICLKEMCMAEEEVYRPLAWSFELYRVCTRHGVRLEEVCGHCGKIQPFIPGYPDWGRCAHCGSLLSENKPATSRVRLDIWMSESIENLVRHLPRLDGQMTAKRFDTFLRKKIDTLAGGNRAEFCRLLGLPRWTMTGWLADGERPTLPQLQAICYGLDLALHELFLPESEAQIAQKDLRKVPEKILLRETRPMLSAQQRARTENVLIRVVNDPTDVRPLVAIAESVNLSRSCLKYWFPEECELILSRYNAARKSKTAAKMKAARDIVIKVIRGLRERGEYPSVGKINAALRSHKISLTRDDLLHAYRDAVSVNVTLARKYLLNSYKKITNSESIR